MRATSGALMVSGYLSRSYAWDVARASSFTGSRSFTEFSARGVLAYLDYFFFPLNSSFSLTGAGSGAGCGGRGSWLGCGQGRLLGCSCYLGLGSAAPAPRFLGTQPPCATQALMCVHGEPVN